MHFDSSIIRFKKVGIILKLEKSIVDNELISGVEVKQKAKQLIETLQMY